MAHGYNLTFDFRFAGAYIGETFREVQSMCVKEAAFEVVFFQDCQPIGAGPKMT
jgi:hypothetical protein